MLCFVWLCLFVLFVALIYDCVVWLVNLLVLFYLACSVGFVACWCWKVVPDMGYFLLLEGWFALVCLLVVVCFVVAIVVLVLTWICCVVCWP